jgi:hypothetical protein
VPFLVSGNQLYPPDLAIDVRDSEMVDPLSSALSLRGSQDERGQLALDERGTFCGEGTECRSWALCRPRRPVPLIGSTTASLVMEEAGLDLRAAPTSGAVLVRAHAYGVNSVGRDSRN